jgi:hypothetical protein
MPPAPRCGWVGCSANGGWDVDEAALDDTIDVNTLEDFTGWGAASA